MKQYKRVGWVVCGMVGTYPYSHALTKKASIEKFNSENWRKDLFDEAKKKEQLRVIPLYVDTDDLKGKKK
jgi:hypothetical protein